MATDSRTPPDANEFDFHELERRLADFAKVVKSDAPFGDVAQALVEQITDALDPVATSLWVVDQAGDLGVERQVNAAELDRHANPTERRKVLSIALARRRAESWPAGGTDATNGEPTNPTPFPLVFAPVIVDSDAVALVEIALDPLSDADTVGGAVRFTAMLAELASDYMRRREVRRLRAGQQDACRAADLAFTIHAAREPREAAYSIANDGLRHVGGDRVSVLLRYGRWRVVAVSGVDAVNRRADVVKRLERLVAGVVVSGRTEWLRASDESSGDRAPELAKLVRDYFDASHSLSVCVAPLVDRASAAADAGRPYGAIVVERFAASREEADAERVEALARHGGQALASTLRMTESGPLWWLGLRKSPLRRGAAGIGRAAWPLVGVAALVAAALAPMELRVSVEGTLQPQELRNVFAPLDGQVVRVSSLHGSSVRAGQPLVELRSPDLDLLQQEAQGEYDAALQRATSIEATLLGFGAAPSSDPELATQLSAEQQEIQRALESQKARLALLRAERKRLIVRSPASGTVLTWDPDRHLMDRPVARGQLLMVVANLDGPWEAALDVPDEDIGPVLERLAQAGGQLPIRLRVATQQGVTHKGVVSRIAQRAESSRTGALSVKMVVDLQGATLDVPRPGATAHATIDCGRSTVFYVAFRKLIDRASGWLTALDSSPQSHP
ncbi:MAG: efflux RND transporter periplasmic adaptor subunit [Lacipirellulaceae bacterium]